MLSSLLCQNFCTEITDNFCASRKLDSINATAYGTLTVLQFFLSQIIFNFNSPPKELYDIHFGAERWKKHNIKNIVPG